MKFKGDTDSVYECDMLDDFIFTRDLKEEYYLYLRWAWLKSIHLKLDAHVKWPRFREKLAASNT